MRTPVKIFLLTLCIFLAFCFGARSSPHRESDSDFSYDLAYEDGFETGYEIGYDEGFHDGAQENAADFSLQYSAGYEDGSYDGYYEGATYTCLFFKDVDRAFQCSLNGGCWHTFVDAYNEYVSAIVKDDNHRIELTWALVSAASGKTISKEEKDLLITAFGNGLFQRNGINLNVQGN